MHLRTHQKGPSDPVEENDRAGQHCHCGLLHQEQQTECGAAVSRAGEAESDIGIQPVNHRTCPDRG